MELNVLNEQGKTVEAADAVFGREYNEALVHQIVVVFPGQRSSRHSRSAQPPRRSSFHEKALAPEGYRPCSFGYDQLAPVAQRWSCLPEHARRKLQPEAEQEDVPRRYGFDLIEARCRCSLCRR